MAKQISEIVPLISKIEEVYGISVDGNLTEIKDRKVVNEMLNDHYVLLNDKEFFVKWGEHIDKPKHDFDEASDNYDELHFPLSYYITTNDGGEVSMDFWDWRESYGEPSILTESPEATQVQDAMKQDKWDIDIDSLYQQFNKGVEGCMNQAECLKNKKKQNKEKQARKDQLAYPKETKDQEINDYARVKSSEWGVVKNVIKLLQQYNQTEQGSPKALKIYENLKAMGYIGSESDLGIQAQYWGECKIISPSYIVNNHDRSSWMYILTSSQICAQDYKAVFEIEQYGGWEGDKRDYIEHLIANDSLDQLNIKPRQVWAWAKENNITEKDYSVVLQKYFEAHKDEEEMISEERFNEFVNDSIGWMYDDIKANYGEIGEDSGTVVIDAYGSRNMPSTADRLAGKEIISGITVDSQAYIVEGDGFAKRLYYNMKPI